MTITGKLLNKQQLAAIKHKSGPLLVVAGAGTGKTTVIVERIKYLIEKKLAQPSEILALTFTEKAAREMEGRIDEAMPLGFAQMWISTFHTFGDRVLRQEALNIGLDPHFKLLTSTFAVSLLRDNLFALKLKYFAPLGNPQKFISALLTHFSRLADENISPLDYKAWVKRTFGKTKNKTQEEKEEGARWKELACAYQIYSKLKEVEGFHDFGDLITKTLQLFRTRKAILAKYQKQFKYILVDEFQDTNFAQNELVILLADKHRNITVVGDDDQAIYRFRGASVSNILAFRKYFPETKIITLTKNYRSGQKILDSAYNLIQFNNPDRLEVKAKIDKKLIAQTSVASGVSFIHTKRVEDEADEVAKTIIKVKNEQGFDNRDFAILVRANNHAEVFTRAFERRGLPFQFLGPQRLFQQEEIKDLTSYLRILYDLYDSPALYRVLSLDHFDINPRDIAILGSIARRKNISLFEVCEKLGTIAISKKSKQATKKVITIIKKHLGLLKKETAGQILYFFLQETGLLANLINPDSADAQSRAANITKFFDKLKSFEATSDEATVERVVDWISLSYELGESPLANDSDWQEVDAVNLLTVHAAKGLEFPVVFLVNLVSARFPSINRSEAIPIPDALIKEQLPVGDYHLQEERRLFYVGITRAKQKLFLTAADYYGDGIREKKLSPFIAETLGEKTTNESLVMGEQMSFLNYQKDTKKKSRLKPQKLKIDFLSYSQIETFRICPLHYKLSYILRIPTPTTSNQSFGNSFHQTLKSFYENMQVGRRPTTKLLTDLLTKNWINEGYKDKTHEKLSFTKAKKFLAYYLANMFDSKVLPIAMEIPFAIKVASKGGQVKVGGKIDRVDKTADGIEIIDYKTGSHPLTQKEADGNLQLSIYALAASSATQKPFGVSPENIKLSLYYFDKPQIITTTRTAKDLEAAKAEILMAKEQIETSDYKCSKGMLCRTCEYELLCNTSP